MYAHVNGMRIWYDQSGEQGSPVLLIMGFGMSSEAWMPQVVTLEKHHQVLRLDNRGVGRSGAVNAPYSLKDMASDCLAIVDKQCFQDVHVVGVSMGGMIAQEFALRYPHRVRSLSLIATHPGGPKYFPRAKAIGLFLKANMSKGKERIEALGKLLYPEEAREDFLSSSEDSQVANELFNPIARTTLKYQLMALARHNTTRRLKRLKGKPVLIVKPNDDILVPAESNDELHRLIPGSRMISFSNAGHGITEQCADELNAHLLAHFSAADEAALAQTKKWSHLRVA